MPTSSADISYRGELMAELFLRGLGPYFLTKSSSHEVPFDFVVGFDNSPHGLNIFAVNVKATERPPGKSYPVPSEWFSKWSKATMPILLLVVDVKLNDYYCAWIDEQMSISSGANIIRVPITRVFPNDDESTDMLIVRRGKRSQIP